MLRRQNLVLTIGVQIPAIELQKLRLQRRYFVYLLTN